MTLKPGKSAPAKQGNDRFDGDEADGRLVRGPCVLRQPDEAIQAIGDHDKGKHRARFAFVLALALQHERKLLALHMRERMGGVDSDGGQRRKDMAHEVILQPVLVGVGQRMGLHQRNPLFRQLVFERGPLGLLPFR